MRAKLFDAARLAAEAIGYTGAGTVEFLARQGRRRVLLPGDEHPTAGGAPGHRGHHRVWIWWSCSCRSPTVSPWPANRPPRAGIRSRPGSTPRIPPRTGSRRPAPCTTSRCPRREREFESTGRTGDPAGLRHRRRFGGVDPLRPDAGQGHLVRADPPAGRAAARRCAGAHPPARRADQPRSAGQRAAPSGVPRRRHRHRVLRHPRPGRAGRTAGRRRDRRGCPRWRPPSPMSAYNRSDRNSFRRHCRAAGATSPRATRSRPITDPSRHRAPRRVPVHPRRRWCCPTTTACDWCPRRRTRWSWPTRPAPKPPYAVSRYGDAVYVDSPLGGVGLTVVPRFVEPGSAVAEGIAGGARCPAW